MLKKSKKITPNYFIKKETGSGFGFGASEDFDQYIDLNQASLETGFSVEHLTMLVNENKIRAVLLNQNWVTKKYWIQDYSKKSNDCQLQSEQLRRNIEAAQKEVLSFQNQERFASMRDIKNPNFPKRLAMFAFEPAVLSYVFLLSLCVFGFLWSNEGNIANKAAQGAAMTGQVEKITDLSLRKNALDTADLAASLSIAEAAGFMANSLWQGTAFGAGNIFTDASDMAFFATKGARDFMRYLVYGRNHCPGCGAGYRYQEDEP